MTDMPYGGSDGATGGQLRRSRGQGGHRPPRSLDTYLLYAVLVAVAAVLALLVWILVAGLMRPQAPRTAVERSIYSAEAAVKASPKDAKAWAAYSAALVAAERYGQAMDAVVKGEAAVGRQPALHLARAGVLEARGDLSGAIKEAEKALALAVAMRKLKVDEALAKGIVAAPAAFFGEEIVDGFILIGEVQTKRGDLDAAIQAYTSALKESPRMADVLTARAALNSKLKRVDEARVDYQAALKYVPDYAPAKEGLKALGGGADK
jgi:tetratricopeptide (TPR) repeat protein